ncbi:histone-like nucleoid-structuring protein Lsr2 [Streptomyces sp. NPDC003328]
MAQKVSVLLVDDIDGGEADETLTFGLDGKTYEIDLSGANADKLRDVLEPFLKAGRKVGSTGGRRAVQTASRGTGKASDGIDPQRVREWAKANGLEVSERGRVPGSIREAYEKANA